MELRRQPFYLELSFHMDLECQDHCCMCSRSLQMQLQKIVQVMGTSRQHLPCAKVIYTAKGRMAMTGLSPG
jgi:hypothetical protein